MMLAHQCSARAYVVILVALLLTVFFLTASRLHLGSSTAFSHLKEYAGGGKPSAGAHKTSPPTPGQTSSTSPADTQLQTQAGDADEDKASPGEFCGDHINFLRSKDLDLTDNILYTRRCVKPVYGSTDRYVVANVSGPLIGSTTTLNLKDDCAQLSPPPCEPLTLHVPPAYPEHLGRYNNFIFGAASSYKRLEDSLPAFSHWLSGTGAQLVLVVSDADGLGWGTSLKTLEGMYRDRDINATVRPPPIKQAIPRLNTPADERLPPPPIEQLHFLLINDMLAVATPQTQWLGVLDDDTFFPALHPLSQALRQYDPTRPYWLGALADNWDSVKAWGYMAFGGAGTFLSTPLAKELSPQLETCLRETSIKTGDGMLRDCMYFKTTTKLTLVEGLYQHDLRGDAAGFFEGGRKVLSIHHWKSWYHEPIEKMAAVTSVCGDCFLQRWRFGGDTLFVNGYSITVYRDGVDKLDLNRMEITFGGGGENTFDFVHGPFRPRLNKEQKKSYHLVAVDGSAQKGQRFRQFYVHRAPKDEKDPDAKVFDEVVELIWEV